jgi:hypothetical protein
MVFQAANLRKLSLSRRETLLALALMLGYGIVAPWAYWRAGPMGLWAATLPAVVCLVCAGVALAGASRCRGPWVALYGVLLGIAIQTGVPLVLAVVASLCSPALMDAGLIYYLMGFYLLALTAKTLLALPDVNSRPQMTQDGV